MVQQVTDENGEISEFPDDATPKEIESALKKSDLRKRVIDITENGLFDRPIKRSYEDLKSLVHSLFSSVSEGIPALQNQLSSDDPSRVMRNVASAIVGVPSQIVNSALDLPEYLAHLESNTLSNKIKEHTPQIPVEKGEEFLVGGEPTKEDQQIRNLIQVLPIFGFGTKKGYDLPIIKKVITGVVGKSSPIIDAQRALLKSEIAAKEDEVAKSKQDYDKSVLNHKESIAQSKREIGKVDPDLMVFNLIDRRNKLIDLTNKISDLKQQISEIPDTSKLPELNSHLEELQKQYEDIIKQYADDVQSHKQAIDQSKEETGKQTPSLMKHSITNIQKNIEDNSTEAERLQQEVDRMKLQQKETSNLPEAEENLIKSQDSLQEHQSLFQNIKDKIGQYLYKGQSHDVKTARILKKKLLASKEVGSNMYDTIKENVENQKITMPNTPDVDKISQDILSLLRKDNTFTPEVSNLLNDVDNFRQKKSIPASDYISSLKSVKGYMREAYKKAYEVGKDTNEERRKFYREQGDQAKEKAQEMDKILKDNIDKDDYELLQKASNYWRENIIPLYKEQLYWQIMEDERLPAKDMATAFRGGTEGSGRQIIRNMILNDQEALRHVVGQRYDVNPKNIQNYNEVLSEYQDKLPELNQLISQHDEVAHAVERSKDNLKQAEINVKSAQKEHTAIENRTIKNEKDIRESEENINDLNENIHQGKQKLSDLSRNIENLESSLKAKDLSSDKKTFVENQISGMKKQQKEMQGQHEESIKLKGEIDSLNNEISNKQEEISKIEKNIEKLRPTLEAQNVSLQTHVQKQMELKDLKKQLKQANDDLYKSTTRLRKVWLLSKLVLKTLVKGKLLVRGNLRGRI